MSEENTQTLTTELSADQVIEQLKSQGSKYATPAVAGQVTTANSFLPYIQLVGGQSKICQEGKVVVGHYVVMKGKNHTDLGAEFVALLLSWRPKAMEYQPNTRSYYDPGSEVFKRTQQAALLPNSNKGFGPEFLLWLPDFETIATFFMGNASGRMESPNLVNCIDKGGRICKMKAEFVTSKKNGKSWHAPRFSPYDLAIKMPDMTVMQGILDSFNNPPVEEEVKPEEAAEQRG